ncbi:MAG: 6-phosphogluconolactonase [Ignavibacteriaceae bacterium]
MIDIFKDKTKLAEAFCEELLLLSANRDKVFLALSGGSTPKIVFQTLVKDYKSKINWNKIHLFWGDERCVPPDDEESNFGMTKKFLLDSISIPEENIHRIRGENNPDAEAKRYSEEIVKYVPLKKGIPSFDIVMLGIGEDGHTASIFPNQMQLLNSDNFCEVAVHPQSGQKRVTLTGRVINNAKEVIFLVTGKNKSQIIKKILVKKSRKFPAEFIQPVEGNLKYFIDSEASELLGKE